VKGGKPCGRRGAESSLDKGEWRAIPRRRAQNQQPREKGLVSPGGRGVCGRVGGGIYIYGGVRWPEKEGAESHPTAGRRNGRAVGKAIGNPDGCRGKISGEKVETRPTSLKTLFFFRRRQQKGGVKKGP